ncbi:MAG: hypothetical protein CMP26_04195 [Roseibacillus sp.]|jgi:predicted RNase H-like nuclease|nr:hypothetical protein [Roseibacillus sp.]HAO97216.1 DUF429 domain-containing protein [Verrucomicrobiales bacterium]|tara:strand:+ start:2606 stop:3289 length:684 start_codon:yes stop_codon:yes gene_type:complete
MIAGVDGCREGWVGVWLDQSGAVAGTTSSASLKKVLQSIPELEVAGIDMPIHLLDAPTRLADTHARRALGPERGRSIFPALPRFTIEERWLKAEFNDVNTTCRQLYGRAFSRQSLHLRSKIAEVNRMEREGFPVIEVHPELSFTAMNAGQPLTFSKKTWGGFRERISLLEENGLHLTDHLLLPVRHLAPDDIVDAAAAAWSAYRHSFGGAISYPPSDQNLREPRIWA